MDMETETAIFKDLCKICPNVKGMQTSLRNFVLMMEGDGDSSNKDEEDRNDEHNKDGENANESKKSSISAEIFARMRKDFTTFISCQEFCDLDLLDNGAFHKYNVNVKEITNHKVILLVDCCQKVIYIHDKKSNIHHLSFYSNITSAISRDLPNYEKKNLYFGSETEHADRTGYAGSPMFSLMVLLNWAIRNYHQNQYIWYKLMTEVSEFPEVNDETTPELSKYVASISIDQFAFVDPEKEIKTIKEIVRTSVRHHVSIADLKSRVSRRFPRKLIDSETFFIEKKYIKYCKAEFYNEIHEFMKKNVDEISADLQGFFQWTNDGIPGFFSKIKVYPLLIESMNIMSEEHLNAFIFESKKQCLDTLLVLFGNLNAEIEFLKEVQETLKLAFINICSENDPEKQWGRVLKNEFYKVEGVDRHKCFLGFLKNCTLPVSRFLKLKAIVMYDADDYIVLKKDLDRLFDGINKDLKTTITNDNNGEILTIEGSFVNIADLRETIEDNTYYEVQINASEIACFNVDITMQGKNFILISPHIYVMGEPQLDVSGADGREFYARAKDGGTIGENGCKGEEGENGQDSGNVFIHANEITNGHMLTITASGGNGARGQDGGNGADGENGNDGAQLTSSEFKKLYPDQVTAGTFLMSQVAGSFAGLAVVEVIASSIFNLDDGKYTKMTLDNGCEVVMSAYVGSGLTTFIGWLGYPKMQAYCIHYGGPGTSGKRGGMGGQGGSGGQEGRKGQINIYCDGHMIEVQRKNGTLGLNGCDGTGGIGGTNGRRGLDNARVEPSQYRTTRSYGPARLALRYDTEDSPDSAYCPYESKERGSSRYARIEYLHRESVERTYARETKKNRRKDKSQEKTKKSEKNDLRSVPIVSRTVMEKFRLFCKVGGKIDSQWINQRIQEISQMKPEKRQVHEKQKVVMSANTISYCDTKNAEIQAENIKNRLRRRRHCDTKGNSKILPKTSSDQSERNRTAEGNDFSSEAQTLLTEWYIVSEDELQMLDISNHQYLSVSEMARKISDEHHFITENCLLRIVAMMKFFPQAKTAKELRKYLQHTTKEIEATEKILRAYPIGSANGLSLLHAKVSSIRRHAKEPCVQWIVNWSCGIDIQIERFRQLADKLLTTISAKQKLALLEKFASTVRSLEESYYEQHCEAAFLIKMRLIHTNFQAAKEILGVLSVDQLRNSIDTHIENIRQDMFKISKSVNHDEEKRNAIAQNNDNERQLPRNDEDVRDGIQNNINELKAKDENSFQDGKNENEDEKYGGIGKDPFDENKTNTRNNLDNNEIVPHLFEDIQSKDSKKTLLLHDGENVGTDLFKGGDNNETNEELDQDTGENDNDKCDRNDHNDDDCKNNDGNSNDGDSNDRNSNDRNSTDDDSDMSDSDDDEYNYLQNLSLDRSVDVENCHTQENRRTRCNDVITRFESQMLSKEMPEIPDDLMKSLKLLQVLDFDEIEVLLNALTTRMLLDGVHLSVDLLVWFISRIVEQTEPQWIKIFTWIIVSSPMTKWPAEYGVLFFVYNKQLDAKQEFSLRSVLYEMNDPRWIPALLELTSPLYDTEPVYPIFKMLRDNQYEDSVFSRLSNLDPCQWEESLNDYYTFEQILDMPVPWTEDEAIEADAYVDELRKIHGNELINKLMEMLNHGEIVTKKVILNSLRNFYYNYWELSQVTLDKLKGVDVENWEQVMQNTYSSKEERSLSCLVEMMQADSNNSHTFLRSHSQETKNTDIAQDDLEIEDIKHLLETTLKNGKIEETFGDKFSSDWQYEFEEKILELQNADKEIYLAKLKDWASTLKNRVKNCEEGKTAFLTANVSEIFAHVEVGISLMTGYKMRNTQRLSIMLMLLSRKHGLLQQISTGEGKTIIIVAFCIVQGLIGHSIDVVTSSPVLAERDAEENSKIYDLFGVSVSHNCSENKEKRIEAYKKTVVYGVTGSFQRDTLLQQFYGQAILGRRQPDILTVDEVDNMLLDKAQSVLYLSHDIPDLDSLEAVFVYIWSFVHGKGMIGSQNDIETIQAAILNAMYGTIRREDLDQCLGHFLSKDEDHLKLSKSVWKHLIDKRIIDKKGKILNKNKLLNNEIELKFNEKMQSDAKERDIEGVVLSFIKDETRKGTQITVPNHLEDFIATHLIDWIKNAFKARYMEERCHYIIDVDRSEFESGQSANVVIMDTDTGKEQFNSQWSEGLHQFLQLKHGCSCSIESLKAVFMSNAQFFQTYGNSIYGLTGTLGSKQERDLLQNMYGIDYINVPTFRPKRFSHKENRVFKDDTDWLREIVTNAEDVATERPVLVICETIQELEKLQEEFSKERSVKTDLYVYKYSYENLDIVKAGKKIEKGCIILATNLAGRGTDIKISDVIDGKGGLHVILTYLPRNLRIQEQAFGRAARRGQKGSGQLYVLEHNSLHETQCELLTFLLMVKNRNAKETERLDIIQQHYDKCIKQEENYFKKFKIVYNEIKTSLENYDDEEKSMVLDACLDQWAFWLDSFGKMFDAEKHTQEQSWLRFKNDLTENVKRISTDKLTANVQNVLRVATSPSQRVKIGKYCLRKKCFSAASQVFARVIANDPMFAEGAHYFTAYLIVKETSVETAESRQMLTLHLYRAEEILKSRIEMYSELDSFVRMVKSMHGKSINSFVASDSYKRQKEIMVELHSTVTQTINDIVGHAVDLQMLRGISGEKVLAQRLLASNQLFSKHEFLERKENVSPELVRFVENQMEKLLERYTLYQSELRDKIQLLKRRRGTFTDKDFENVLPSREEFWDVLRKSSLLSNEKTYLIVNIETLKGIVELKDTFDAIQTQLSRISSNEKLEELHTSDKSVPKSSTCSNEKEREDSDDQRCGKEIFICLHPEQIHDIVSKKCFAIDSARKWEIDARYWEVFESHDVVTTNKVALLKVENQKVAKLIKYDGIEVKDLLEISGMSKSIAEEIFSSSLCKVLKRSELPKISDVDLKKNKRFETEVKNLLYKHFIYREMLLQTIEDGVIPFEQLESNPHERLWRDMIDFKIITPILVKENISQDDIQQVIDNEQNIFKYGFDSFCYFFDFKEKSSLALSIYEWKSAIFKYETLDVDFKEFDDLIDEKMKTEAKEELFLMAGKGFDHVIVLEEMKWSWRTILKIIGIVALGLAQICLGVVIEVFTLGAGTVFAQGLIGEGVGDILFAVECAISGHCSMKEYLKQKAISICVTVVTCGVGAWFSRGSKFSRFGHKIANKSTLVGKELVKEVGKKRLAKEVAKRVGLKVVEAVAIGAATAMVDKAVENMLRSTLETTCQGILENFKHLSGYLELKDAVTELCKKTGSQKAMNVAVKSCENELNLEFTKFTNAAMKIVETASQGLGNAAKKLSKTSVGNKKAEALIKFSGVVSNCMKYAPYIAAVGEMTESCRRFVSRLPNAIKDETKRIDSDNESDVVEVKDVDKILAELENILVKRLEGMLENRIVKPAMHHGAKVLVTKLGTTIKEQYKSFKTKFQAKKFETLKSMGDSEYQEKYIQDTHLEDKLTLNEKIQDVKLKAMIRLQRKVRSPELYADMLLHGLPMGVHEAQAISNALGRPINIIQCGKGGKSSFQKEFTPTENKSSENALTIYFKPDKKGGIGHFSDKPFGKQQRNEATSGRNNCLLDAANRITGKNLDRKRLADIMKTDPVSREQIQRGIHMHYSERVGTGGASRGKKREAFVDKKRTELIERAKKANQENKELKLDKKDLRQLRDPGESTGTKSNRKCGNHEIMPLAGYLPELIKRDMESNQNLDENFQVKMYKPSEMHGEEADKVTSHGHGGRKKVKQGNREINTEQSGNVCQIMPFSWTDISFELRVDTRYAAYDHEGSLQGHPVSVATEPTCNKRNQCATGPEIIHKNVAEKGIRCDTPEKCAVEVLQGYMDAIGSKQKFNEKYNENEHYFENRYTATGHSLNDKDDRKEYFSGLERERYKIAAVIEKMGGSKNPVTLPETRKDRAYKKYVDSKLAKTIHIEQIGKILRKPAPYHVNNGDN